MRRAAFLSSVLLAIGVAACSQPDRIACTAPRPYWKDPRSLSAEGVQNRIALDLRGKVFWNGVAVTGGEATRLLEKAQEVPLVPAIVLTTEMGTPCKALDSLRDKIDRVYQCRRKDRPCAEGVVDSVPLSPSKAVGPGAVR